MTPRTITGAHRIYVLPKERNKSEYVDYCAQSTTLVEALTKDSLVEHLIIKCSDPWGFVFPEQLVSQTAREKPLRITLLLTEHIDHVRGNLPRWEEFVARARTEGMLKGQVYKSGWEDYVVPRGVYVPSGLMTRIACRDKGKYASNFPDPTKGGKQEDGFTYRFITDASLAKGSTAEELAQIRAYFGVGVDLSHTFKPIRKIKNGVVTDTQADMWVYEFLYARQMIEAHGASSGVYMNMLYWLNASEANITDFWEVAEATEDTASNLEGKLDKPTNGNYVLDAEISNKIKEKITNDTKLQELIKGEKGEKGDQGAKGDKGDTPKLTLDEQFRLYADGNLVSSQTLKGDRGEEGPRGTTGAKGDKGDKGDTGASGTNVGRNLLLNSGAPRFQDGRYTEYKLAYPIDKEGAYFLSFDVAFDKNQLYTPYGYRMKVILGYQTALETTGYIDYYESLHKGYSRLRLNVTKNSTYQGSAKTIYIYPNEDYENPDTDPRCGKFTIKNVMLEYGTKPTVWSPAPEDFLAELDKYTTVEQYKIDRADDKRELDKKLDKPTNGNYVLDKDIASQIGGLMKVGGRNLIKHGEQEKRTWGEWASYTLYKPIVKSEPLTLSFDVLNVEVPPDGGSFLIYFFYYSNFRTEASVRYEEGKKRYNVTVSKLDFNVSLYGNDKNYPPNQVFIYPNNSYKSSGTGGCFTIANIKLERGNVATDWTPAPEDIQSEINDLQKNSPTPFQKDWLNKMGQVLFAESPPSGSGKMYHINGLSIDRSVFLRFSGDTPSALIGGHGSKAMLMAGVQDYGTSNQSAQMEIYQDGSAKFGAVKMLHNGMLVENDFVQMAFDKKAVREPLLISDTQPEFVESLALSNVENRNVVSGANVYLTNSTRTRQYNFSTSNPSTKMTITIERVRCEVYPRNCALELLVDGVQIMSWRGDISYEQVDGSGFAGGGTKLNIQKTPSEETNITIERTLSRGSHTLLLRNTSTDSTDKGTFYGLKCNLYYDASKGCTILSASGFRAYTNNSRYFDIDRREKYYPPDASGGGGDDDLIPAEGVTNPYIARIRGGILLDRLDLEQPLDAPGCVLAGGRVENGYVRASFGKYKNKRNDSKPIARFDNDDKIYCVYHSIGNTNYTPIVTSCAGAWGDVPQVIGVYEYRFDVRFINYNNERSVGWNFNYVCYKGD